MTLRTMRAVRRGQVAGFTLTAADFAYSALRGNVIIGLAAAILAVVWLALICLQTVVIKRQRRLDRPRPDYCAVARMEQAIYGETFEHAGAPQRPARREAEKETTAGRECGCGSPEWVDAGAFGTLLRLIGGAADHAIAGE